MGRCFSAPEKIKIVESQRTIQVLMDMKSELLQIRELLEKEDDMCMNKIKNAMDIIQDENLKEELIVTIENSIKHSLIQSIFKTTLRTSSTRSLFGDRKNVRESQIIYDEDCPS